MSRLRMKTYRAKDFYQKPELVKKASRLALPMNDGAMRSMIHRQAPGNIILAMEGEDLVGWAYLNRERHDTSYNTHVYVRSTRRKEGIGEKIVKKARNFASTQKRGLFGRPWSDSGVNLYKKMGVKYTPIS